MVWTQEQLDAIAAVIAKGIKTVEYDGRTITYQNVDQLLAVLHDMDIAVAATADAVAGATVFATFSRS